MADTNRQRTVVRPRPTKLSGVALMVAGGVFLLFAAVPLGTAEGEAAPFAYAFGAVWILVCLSFIGYGLHVVVSDRPAVGMVLEVEGAVTGSSAAPSGDFAARLRDLAKLREDHLVTEEEYQRKRAEILDARW
jgi:hypothetical protein